MPRKTRGQAAKARGASSSDSSRSASPAMNGNGNGSVHKASALPDWADSENIFLFWPNIIGMDVLWVA